MQFSWTTSADTLQLALRAGGPRRAALEDALRSAIRDQRLVAGTRLPSTRALAADLGVARGTVVDAYAQLVGRGLPQRAARRRHVGRRRGARRACRPDGGADASAGPIRLQPWTARPDRRSRAPRGRARSGGACATRPPRASATATREADPSSVRRSPRIWPAPAARVADPELIVVCAGFVHGLSLLARVLHARGARRARDGEPLPAAGTAHVGQARRPAASCPSPVDERGARTDLLAGTGAAPCRAHPRAPVPAGRAAASGAAERGDRLGARTGGLRDRGRLRRRAALRPAADRRAAVARPRRTSRTPARRARRSRPACGSAGCCFRRRCSSRSSPCGWPRTSTCPPPTRSRSRELLLLGSVRAPRAPHALPLPSPPRPARRDAGVDARPSVTPVGISAGLRVLLELPPDGPSAAELVDRAARRSIEISSVDRSYHGGRAARDGLIVGYAALPEHAFESGLDALGDVLATSGLGR